jgi:hypothetical protein
MNKNTTWNNYLRHAIKNNPKKSLKQIIIKTKKKFNNHLKGGKSKTFKNKKYKLEYKI